ncbi:Uncharacterized protein OBRU01_05201, partial [Operophtera brumata]
RLFTRGLTCLMQKNITISGLRWRAKPYQSLGSFLWTRAITQFLSKSSVIIRHVPRPDNQFADSTRIGGVTSTSCSYCEKTDHTLYRCESFKAMHPWERKSWARKSGHCFKWLRKHYANKCQHRNRCFRCGSPDHNSLICSEPRSTGKSGEVRTTEPRSSSSTLSQTTQGNRSPSPRQAAQSNMCQQDQPFQYQRLRPAIGQRAAQAQKKTINNVLDGSKIPLPIPGLAAYGTCFGHVIMGSVPTTHQSSVKVNTSQRERGSSVQDYGLLVTRLEDVLERFWKLEEPPLQPAKHPEHMECERLYQFTTKRMQDGKYIVRLRLLSERTALDDSRPLAIQRLKTLERKMEKNPDFAKKYK